MEISLVGLSRIASPLAAAFLPSCHAYLCFSERGAGNREILYTAEARLSGSAHDVVEILTDLHIELRGLLLVAFLLGLLSLRYELLCLGNWILSDTMESQGTAWTLTEDLRVRIPIVRLRKTLLQSGILVHASTHITPDQVSPLSTRQRSAGSRRAC